MGGRSFVVDSVAEGVSQAGTGVFRRSAVVGRVARRVGIRRLRTLAAAVFAEAEVVIVVAVVPRKLCTVVVRRRGGMGDWRDSAGSAWVALGLEGGGSGSCSVVVVERPAAAGPGCSIPLPPSVLLL